MSNQHEPTYTLVPSTNRGRYALDDPETGHDLTTGEPLAIWLGGHWVEGHIEHSNHPTAKYPDADGLILSLHGPQIGYYFVAADGSVCGLCVGMRVRRR